MIPRVHARTHTPHAPLSEALGRPVSPAEGLTEHTVVAHWPGLDYFTLDDEQEIWTALEWAEHLAGPFLERPLGAGPDDRLGILHLDVRLHPDDRQLTIPEWSEAAHRLARAAGIEVPGEANGCRWIAVQAQPGRLDLIANPVRHDRGFDAAPPTILRRLSREARRIERDLHLFRVRGEPTGRPIVPTVPTAATSLAGVLAQLADERTGPLATVRGLIEHTAHRVARQPGSAGTGTAHHLELLARRLHAIQQDLDTTAVRMAQPRITPVPPGTRHTAQRSL
ncbi:relaxase/mobilization nuclease [Streptomyces sp. NPDC058961]|uniref:relaxase/mobilization nuclease n=1 Tax=Streptomyces sp. NPDC058961 TaxID=3346680 RepID=UPI0036B23041